MMREFNVVTSVEMMIVQYSALSPLLITL